MGRPNKFNGMMNEFCVGLGWCGCVSEFIPETGPVSADDFARWLIMADGIDPNRTSASDIGRWMHQLKAVYVKHMGAEVIDASNLRSEWKNGYPRPVRRPRHNKEA
jgi:hypothetical protein